MKTKNKLFLVLTTLFLLSGCQGYSLSDKQQHFSTEQNTYRFQLPKKWEKDPNYQRHYNKETVYGAEDTNSVATLAIRSRGTAKNEAAFAESIQKLLQEVYGEKKKIQLSKIGEYPMAEYLVQSRVENKMRWVHLYYVLAGDEIIEFQFKTPQDHRDKKRTEVLKKSVRSLKWKKQEKQKKKNPLEDQALNEADNDQINLQLTGYKFTQVSGQNLLFVRYTCTNKGENPIIPEDTWKQAVTLTQNEQPLQVYQGAAPEPVEELTFLKKQSQVEIGKDGAVETAQFYQLASPTETVKVTFNQKQFPNKEAIWLKAENEGERDE